jgi:O-antigen ligase
LKERFNLHKRESRDEPVEKPNVRQEARPIWRFFERFIFYGLLVIIALTAIPYGTVEEWWIAIFECAIFALGALWFLLVNIRGDSRVPSSRMLWPLIAILGFIIVQTINFGGRGGEAELPGALSGAISADVFETRLVILKLLVLILTLALLLRHTTSHRRLRALINLVIGVGVVSALFGILRQTTQHDSPGYFLPYLMPNSGYGQFINRNHFAFLMEMAFGLVLGLVVGGGVSRERVLIYVSFAMPIWFALVLSNSRGGIFSMLGQLLFAALMFTMVRRPQFEADSNRASNWWLWRFRSSIATRILLGLCLLIAVAVSVIWIGGDQLASRFDTGQNEAGVEKVDLHQGESRAEVWRSTWALIKDYPLAGVGFGGYWAVIPKYHDASGELTPQQAHNDYLEILASGGLIGVALCCWFVFAFARTARVEFGSKDSFRRAACFGALVGLFGVAVHSLFDFGLHVTINALIFIVLIVLATARVRDEPVRNRGKESSRQRLSTGY